MKILLVNKSLVLGGIERVLIIQRDQLVKAGFEVDVVVFDSRFGFDVDWAGEVVVLKSPKELKKKVEASGHKYDWVICHAQSRAIIREVKGLSGVRRLFYVHGMLSKHLSKSGFIRRYVRNIKWRKLFSGLDVVAVSSEVEKDILACGLKPERIRVFENPVDVESITKKSRESTVVDVKRPYLLWVGRIVKDKNLDLMIDGYRHVSDSYDLVIVGDGDKSIKSELVRKVKHYGISRQVHFVGAMSNPFPVMKGAEALLLTSFNEGYGMVLIEALVLGVPVVSTKSGGPEGILKKYYPHGLVASWSPVDFAETIRKCVKIPPNIEKIMGQVTNDIRLVIS